MCVCLYCRCGLRLRSQAIAVLNSCSFLSNKCFGHGAGIFADSAKLIEIHNSTFNSNAAYTACCGDDCGSQAQGCGAGGAILAAASQLNAAQGNSFTSNSAFRGGGVFLWTGMTSAFTTSTVSGNRATDGGGGIFWTDSAPTFSSGYVDGSATYLSGNTALYGNDLSTWTYGLLQQAAPPYIISGQTLPPSISSYVFSGQTSTASFVYSLVDFYNNTILTCDTSTKVSVSVQSCLACASSSPQATATITSVSSVPLYQDSIPSQSSVYGTADLSHFILTGVPNSIVAIEFKPVLNSGRTVVNPNPVVPASIYPCPPGTYVPTSMVCTVCDPGYWSNATGMTACIIAAAGKYTNTYVAATQLSPALGAAAAVDCSPGTVSTAAGATACTPCTPGAGNSPGTYAPTSGMNNCLPCPAGSNAIPATGNPTACACIPGFYWDSVAQLCFTCPTGGNCTMYGTLQSSLLPVPGYATMLHSPNTSFFACLSPGCVGNAYGQANCAPGYVGNMCDSCLNTGSVNTSYGRSGDHGCVPCGNPSSTMALLVIFILIAFVVVGFLIRSTLENTKINPFQILMKIIINNIQLNAVAAGFNFSWPGVMQNFLNAQKSGGNVGSSIFTFDCLMLQSDIPGFEGSSLAFAFLPFLVLIAVAVFCYFLAVLIRNNLFDISHTLVTQYFLRLFFIIIFNISGVACARRRFYGGCCIMHCGVHPRFRGGEKKESSREEKTGRGTEESRDEKGRR
jgi:hypothetical protein